VTVNAPLDPAIVPAVLVPSPQSTTAVNSLAGADVSTSVKVATVTLLRRTPGSPEIVVPCPFRTSLSATERLPALVRVASSDARTTVAVS
jgi:hypothetical protein